MDDVDLALDWWFLSDVQFQREAISESLSRSQITFTVVGTVTWLFIATDGRAALWLANALFWVFVAPLWLVFMLMRDIFHSTVRSDNIFWWSCCSDYFEAINSFAKSRIATRRISSGLLLLLGIIFEDVPQTIITWRIEEETDNTNGSNSTLSSLAVANILTSVFNLLVRAADAFDQRMDAPIRKNILRTFRGHNIVFSVDTIGDDQFISGSFDRTIKLWNKSTGECIHTFEGHRWPVTSVATIGDDRFISGSDDRTIKLWNISTGECIHTFE